MDIEPILRYKIIMYQHWVASEDIETQQKGVVLILWPSVESDYTTGSSGGGSSSNNEQTSVWDKYFTSSQNVPTSDASFHRKSFLTPIRFSSVHFCGQNKPAFRLLSSMFYFGLPKNNIDLKSRYKSHFGEPIELRYQLQGYGKLHINCCYLLLLAETCFVFCCAHYILFDSFFGITNLVQLLLFLNRYSC